MNKYTIKNQLNTIINNINKRNNNIIHSFTNKYMDEYNGLGDDQLHIHDIDNWSNQIYKFNNKQLIDTIIIDNIVSKLLMKMFSIHMTNKYYNTYITKPIIKHTFNTIYITFDYSTNYNDNNNMNNINKQYIYDIMSVIMNNIGINNIDNNNYNNNITLSSLLSSIYNKKVIINADAINRVQNSNELFLYAYKEHKYNLSINNSNKKDNSSILNNMTLYNPSIIDDTFINNIGKYYTNIYNNISSINNINDINITNILNNSNINNMDDTMTNKYLIGILMTTIGKGPNISATGRSEYNKYIKGSFINYSSKSHIKTIYNNNNNAYNTFTSLRNKNRLNNINNNMTINNQFIIYSFGIEGIKTIMSYN